MKNVLSILDKDPRLLRNYLQMFSDRFILHPFKLFWTCDDVCHILCLAFSYSIRTYLVAQSITMCCVSVALSLRFAAAADASSRLGSALRQSQRLMRYLPIPSGIVRVYFISCMSTMYKMNDAIIGISLIVLWPTPSQKLEPSDTQRVPQIRAQSATSATRKSPMIASAGDMVVIFLHPMLVRCPTVASQAIDGVFNFGS
jgi:hypothetical protein